jgi:hypothetical protein
MALSKDELQEAMIQAGIPLDLRSKAMKVAEEIEADKQAEKDPNKKKNKNKFTIVVRTDDPAVKDAIASGWIVQTPEDQPNQELITRMTIAAARTNEAAKSKKKKIFTWTDFFQYIKPKNTKDEDILVKIKTKDAVEIVFLEKSEIQFS